MDVFNDLPKIEQYQTILVFFCLFCYYCGGQAAGRISQPAFYTETAVSPSSEQVIKCTTRWDKLVTSGNYGNYWIQFSHSIENYQDLGRIIRLSLRLAKEVYQGEK